MKKSLSLFVLMTLVFTLFGCVNKSATEQIILDTDGYDISYSRLATIDGHFPQNASDVTEFADLIVIATPTESFSNSTIDYYGNRVRKCSVSKVLKGNYTEGEISVIEFCDTNGSTIHMETSTPIMTKGYEYIIFCFEDSDDDGIHGIVNSGAYALNTEINNRMGLYKKSIYGDILVDYKQYFKGDDIRIKQNKKPFTTELLGYAEFVDCYSATVEFEGLKYSCFDGDGKEINYYFPKNSTFINTGKTVTLNVSENETYVRDVYRIQDESFDKDIIFLFFRGKLTPFRIMPKDPAQWEFKDRKIAGARFRGETDDIPLETALKLAKILSENKDEKPVFMGNIYEVVFYLENKLETSVSLYEGAGYLGGRQIGKELEEELLKAKDSTSLSSDTPN